MNFRVIILLLLTTPVFAQQKASVSNLRKVVEVLASDSLKGRAYKSEEIKLAREYIIENFQKVGLKPYGNSFEHKVSWHEQLDGNQEVTNIVGYIEGSDAKLKDEFLVIGAHYDHVGYTSDGDTVIYNGADDNASGVSGIIELARLLLSNNQRPARSILIVAFDAEEVGLVGSTKFVKNSPIPLDKIKAMMSVDMIGRADLINGVIFSGIGSLKGITISPSLFSSEKNREVKLVKSPSSMVFRTDTGPFFRKNIPALYIDTGLKGFYHKPEDDANTLDYEGMAFVVDNLKKLVEVIAEQPNVTFHNPIPTVALGFTFGGGLNHFRLTSGGVDNKSTLTFNAGISTLIQLGKRSAIQSDVLLKAKTSRSAIGNIIMPSIFVPVHFMLISPYNSSRGFFGIGPYYSYSFQRYVSGDKMPMASKDKNDYGLSVMVGGIGMNYQVALRCCYGFKRMMEDQPKMHYRSVELSFTKFLRY